MSEQQIEPRLTCCACGRVTDSALPTCKECEEQFVKDRNKIERLETDGHTFHCAARQVWGDGECECGKIGIVPGVISKEILAGKQ